MDEVQEIKSRLPIEELVAQYCALKKKGKNFACICPFHNDTHPSMTVSPDKGIAYCFACQSGGDIFSFYQKIESVDFRQALTELAAKAGVTLEVKSHSTAPKKDEKDRVRSCLNAALQFYMQKLLKNESSLQYLAERKVDESLRKKFALGFAPNSFSDTYQFLLKEGFKSSDILAASLAIKKDLSEGKIYDRFRNRIMFPIYNFNGDIVGFGGRALGEDDAKYINSSDGILYNKSIELYGMHLAKETMREKRSVILVEGYFDVIACHRLGISHVVAVSGTALTEMHVKALKRYVDTVILCLDQDRAGRDAARRAFILCSQEGLSVSVIPLKAKDPDEAARSAPEETAALLSGGGIPYFNLVFEELKQNQDLDSVEGRKSALKSLLPLLDALQSSVERSHELSRAAAFLSTTESALKEDLEKLVAASHVTPSVPSKREDPSATKASDSFSTLDITLGLFLFYPKIRHLLPELISPSEGFAKALFEALKEVPDGTSPALESLPLPEEYRERVSILALYCEHHQFAEWSESIAVRELRTNIANANRQTLQVKLQEISSKLLEAHRNGKSAEKEKLSTQYQQLLKLTKMASVMQSGVTHH